MSQQQNEVPESSESPLPEVAVFPDGMSGMLAINSSFMLLLSQNQALVEENRLLRVQAEQEQLEKAVAEVENRQLRSQAVGRELPKRKYSKRRSWLEKKFKCPHSGCHGAYSSKIALNLHARKRHALLKLEA
jgi:hypothetical protein